MQSETGQKLSIRVAGIGGAGAKIVSALCALGGVLLILWIKNVK